MQIHWWVILIISLCLIVILFFVVKGIRKLLGTRNLYKKGHSQNLKHHNNVSIKSKQEPQLEVYVLDEAIQNTLSVVSNLYKEERVLNKNKEEKSLEGQGKSEMEDDLNSDRSQNQKLIQQNIKFYSGESKNENNLINNQDIDKQNNDAQQFEAEQNLKENQINLKNNSQAIEIEISKLQGQDNKSLNTNRGKLSKQISQKDFQSQDISCSEFSSTKHLTLLKDLQMKKQISQEAESQSPQKSIVIQITPTDNQNQQKYKFIRVNKNKLMYVEDRYNYYTGLAFYYKVQYDKEYNPKFEIYEGQFDKGKKSGKGILYGGKSKFINYDGDWKDDQQHKEIQEQKQEQEGDVKIEIEQIVKPKKKIQIFEEGKLIQIDKKNQNQIPFDQQTQWVKFNQQYCTKDMEILKKETVWFTSSIIDGLVEYLNIQMENQLINFLKKDVKRYLFCPSYLYTNMSQDRIQNNLIIFQNHILEFEPIDFNLTPLFQRVYFAINKSKSHFFLLYIDFPSKSLNIVDSIQKKENAYSTEIKIFQNIFQQQITSTNFISCTQQRNGYDCGPYTCLNMYQDFYKLMQVAYPKNKQQTINNPLEMRQFLFDILKNNDNK
ncbi:unnamed protein product (macronuclear) [Paramecium tetraurelia]|uniref:Ubiquitin-like protease family profile domain-containing protein n=1 Tax=Paramecium tetraurelia TaxID=5888 RepID=A0E3W2_PARTE|nr:uncharacterized protein GSPATT00023152001 [Paramecium tetraurelia]CAK89979.1 unnamed protein product [Paramecium tetraurelia]|eukprot:XP_001457376.1 hypothetical protein (macronuclear) [Paramecium tetraurelia strain d4-2]